MGKVEVTIKISKDFRDRIEDLAKDLKVTPGRLAIKAMSKGLEAAVEDLEDAKQYRRD